MAVMVLGCHESPAGSVLVKIDTNVEVPRLFDRVRIDIYSDTDGRWLETQDQAVAPPMRLELPQPDHGFRLPVSFGIRAHAHSEVLVRVRGYAEGRVRDYLGERFEASPWTTDSAALLAQAPAVVPTLDLDEALTLRTASDPTRGADMPACDGYSVRGGLAKARVEVSRKGNYRVAVTTARPGLDWALLPTSDAGAVDVVSALGAGDAFLYAQPVLFVQDEQTSSTVACGVRNEQRLPFERHLPSITVNLPRGNYILAVGNGTHVTSRPGPLEATLQWSLEGEEALDKDLVVVGSPDDSKDGGVDVLDPGTPDALGPRLLDDNGIDITPAEEPSPQLAIDVIARIELDPTVDKETLLELPGECFGVMADLLEGRSCAPEKGELRPLLSARLHELGTLASDSKAGSWLAGTFTACPEVGEERVCIGGGSLLLGDPTVVELGEDNAAQERVAVVETFVIDRYEYTVARYRALRRSGGMSFEEWGLTERDAPRFSPTSAYVEGQPDAYCTFSGEKLIEGVSTYEPAFEGREARPLSCVSWYLADAICRAEGGALPSSAQWEYAAAQSGRAAKATYPWGNADAGCRTAAVGRYAEDIGGSTDCYSKSAFGPVDVSAHPWTTADVTADGVSGMGGNLAEWTADAHLGYEDRCWAAQGPMDPRCEDRTAPFVTYKGASWRDHAGQARIAARRGAPPSAQLDSVGFRCVYPVAAP